MDTRKISFQSLDFLQHPQPAFNKDNYEISKLLKNTETSRVIRRRKAHHTNIYTLTFSARYKAIENLMFQFYL